MTERGGQVEPQASAAPVRPALPPLRGATVMGFSNRADREFQLDVRVGKATNVVRYAVRTNGTVDFEFVDARGNVRRESHVLGARKGGGNGDACGRRRRGGRGAGTQGKEGRP